MSQPPLLALSISRSPLLPNTGVHLPLPHVHVQMPVGDLLSALLTKRKLNLSGDSILRSKRSPYDHPSSMEPTSFSSFTSYESAAPASASPSSSLLDPTSPTPALFSHTHINKPLPSLPHHPTPIPPHAIITILNLLDALDADVALQVARVKEGIKEAYTMVDAYRAERGRQVEWQMAKREWEKGETKEVDSDFWLGV